MARWVEGEEAAFVVHLRLADEVRMVGVGVLGGFAEDEERVGPDAHRPSLHDGLVPGAVAGPPFVGPDRSGPEPCSVGRVGG